jgi:Na+-translocating ferredoxin:NAD+ oxidoreductase RnfG subunit
VLALLKALLTIGILGAACGALLVGTDRLTHDQIEANRNAKTRATMESMLGKDLPEDFTIGAHQPCEDGVFSEVSVSGYGGSIDVLALWRGGRMSLRVTRHAETPGIGTFIEHERDPWLPGQDGKARSEWRALDTVAGATITTAAIKRAAETAFTEIEDGRCG